MKIEKNKKLLSAENVYHQMQQMQARQIYNKQNLFAVMA